MAASVNGLFDLAQMVGKIIHKVQLYCLDVMSLLT